MKNIITVIYPAEFKATYVIESDKPVTYILERVFDQWNAGSSEECELFKNSRIRSLSVNDIVCINGVDYQCKSCGWEQVSTEYTAQLEKDVRSNPNFFQGAYFALGDVMWNRRKPQITVEKRAAEQIKVKFRVMESGVDPYPTMDSVDLGEHPTPFESMIANKI
jgi:hypothetical protein